MRKEKANKGITLVALVITIIVLLILAGITLNLMIGQEGIITKAQEAGRTQKIAEIKEKIGLAILDAEMEARIRKEQLEQEQVKDIVSQYGELQEDGDTIKLKEVDAEVSLKDIYNGTTSNTGSYTANKEKIEQLEKQVAELEKALEESSKTEGEKAQELTALKEELAKVTVTEDRILKGYTAYKNDGLITGTMENRGEQTNWSPSTSATKTYEAGYYPNSWTVSTANAYTQGQTLLVPKYCGSGHSAATGRSVTASYSADLSNYTNLARIAVGGASTDYTKYVKVTDKLGNSKQYTTSGSSTNTFTLYDSSSNPYNVTLVISGNAFYALNLPPDCAIQTYANSSSGSSAKGAGASLFVF